MGRRGPAPTPTPLLQLRGSWRGDYGRDGEPQPARGRPRCPSWLDAQAKAAWKQLVPQLESMGVLTKIDGHALTVLCQTWARWRKAEEFVQKNGETYPVRDESGRIKFLKVFPQVRIAETNAKMLNRLFGEFGLTPSARTRINVESAQDQTNDKRRFLDVG